MKKIYFLLLVMSCSVGLSFSQTKIAGLNARATGAWHLTKNMFDGQIGTIWQPDNSPDHFFVIDLKTVRTVAKIQILWDAANALDYDLSFSTDNINFTNKLEYRNMAGGQRQDVIDNLNIVARYIKFQGIKLQTAQWGYGIYEFEVFEKTTDYFLEITPQNIELVEGETAQFRVTAKDAVGNPYTLTQPTNWVVSGGGTIDANGLFTATTKGYYSLTATNGSAVTGTNFDVLPPAANLSLMGFASASTQSVDFPVMNVIDDVLTTNWNSVGGGEQYITIDLGEKKNISDMIIYWETSNAKNYTIQISDDDANWTVVKTLTNMPTGVDMNRNDRFYNFNQSARYVKMNATTNNTWWPYNMWEFKIYGGDFTNGLDDIKSLVSVYPNPTTDMLNFTEEIATATLYSIEGKVILDKKNVNKIDISNLANGMYLIYLTDKMGNKGFQKIQKL